MSRTIATAVHAAAVVLGLVVVLAGGAAYAVGTDPSGHDHPAPTTSASPGPGMSGMSAEEHAAMGDAGHVSSATVAVDPGVSDGTRAAVIGGFGVVNAVAVGAALVLRRRGATGRRPRVAR